VEDRTVTAEAKGKGWLIVIAVCVGIWLVQNGMEPVAPPLPSAAEAFTPGSGPDARSGPGSRSGSDPGPGPTPGRRTEAAAAPMRPSAPVRLRIPGIQVDAPVMRLGLGPGNSLDVPPPGNSDIAGWYKDGTPPGAKGTAIITGHVDNARGPAVFYALGTLRKGHRVEVTRRDGRTAVFAVDAVEVYENNAFPDRKVYGAAARPELRVITCGGGFSAKTGYRGNVVAYAHLVGAR
jgi:hypothetical protein